MLSELWTINIIWSINIVWTINIVSINLSEFYPQGACAWWTQPMLFTLSCSDWTSQHDKETGFPSYSQTGTRIRYKWPICCFFLSDISQAFLKTSKTNKSFISFQREQNFLVHITLGPIWGHWGPFWSPVSHINPGEIQQCQVVHVLNIERFRWRFVSIWIQFHGARTRGRSQVGAAAFRPQIEGWGCKTSSESIKVGLLGQTRKATSPWK